MPPLAGIVNLQDDPSVDLAMARSIGGAIGGGVAALRIRQQEELDQTVQAEMASLLYRADTEGWKPDQVLSGLSQVPNMAKSKYGRAMQERALAFQMQKAMTPAPNMTPPDGLEVTGGQYDEFGQFRPTFGRPRQAEPDTQIVPEMRDGRTVNVLYDKDTGREVRVLGERPQDDGTGELNNLDRQYNSMLTAYNRTFDDFGEPIADLAPERQFAQKQIIQLRQKIEAATQQAPQPAATQPGQRNYTVDPLAYEPSPGPAAARADRPTETPPAAKAETAPSQPITLRDQYGEAVGTIPAPPAGKVLVQSPDGQYGYIDAADASEAETQGYRIIR